MRPPSVDTSARWAAAFRQNSRATATASLAALRSGVFTVLRSSGDGLLCVAPARVVGIDPQVGVPGRNGVRHVQLGRLLALVAGHVGDALAGEEALPGGELDRLAVRGPEKDDLAGLDDRVLRPG